MTARWWTRLLVGALAVILAAEFGARAVLGATDPVVLRWHDHGTQLKAEQMAERADADLVVIGTSMAMQGLVPSVLEEQLGVEAYNAGLEGGVPVVTGRWTTDVVVPELRPDTVVWGLSVLDLSTAYGDGPADAFEAAPATATGWLAVLDRRVAAVSELVAARAVLRDPAALAGSRRDEARDLVAAAAERLGPDGERIEFTEAVTAVRRDEVAGRLTPFGIDRDDLAAVARTVSALRADGIEVVLVDLPVPPRLLDLYPGGAAQHDVVREAIALLAAELDVELVEPSDTYGDDDFVDFTHLDADGAARLSAEVAEALDD